MKLELHDDDIRRLIIDQFAANKWPQPHWWQITVRSKYGSYNEPLVSIDFDEPQPKDEPKEAE